MKKPKKAKSVMINQTPQVQSPIVPVHVTKTTSVLDEADAPAHRQSAPQLGQRKDDDDIESGDRTEMRTFRTEGQERHGRNYGRRSSPSPPPRRRRSPSRSPDRSKIERRRMEDRSRDREEEEEEPKQ